MPDIRIERPHSLGLPRARKLAFQWAEQVEEQFDMQCTYEEGDRHDEVNFTRSGVTGTLLVAVDHFDLDATLGFLLGVFKSRIEAEIVKTLDDLLKPRSKPVTAAKSTAKPAAKPVVKPAAKTASKKAPASRK